MNSDTLLKNKINSIIELYSNGNIQKSLEVVEASIIEHPEESLLQNIRGVLYKATGHLEIAAKSFNEAVKIKPDFADAHYNLGLTLQELNQFDDAIKSYEMALNIQSNYAKAHNNLGTIYKEIRQIDQAIQSFEKALKIEPDFAEAHNNLGNALNELNELDKAVLSYKNALNFQPNYFEVHNNLGNTLNELGNLEEAITHYDKAIVINPEYAEAINNLGATHSALGQLEKAIVCFEKAIAINPDYAEAYNNLGVTLNDLGELKQAILCYEKALKIYPDYDEAYYNIGVTLNKVGEIDEALKYFNRAISINPDYSDAHYNLGSIFQDLGQLDKAFNCYISALAIEPENTQFHRNLSTLKHYGNNDTQFEVMQSIYSNINLSDSERIDICFALAKVYEDLGQKDELFKVLNEGNHLRKKELNYLVEKDINNHLLHRKIFESTSLSLSNYKPLKISPIFIVGMPRSGTTLVEQIISSHTKIHGAGELSALDKLITPIMNTYLTENKPLLEDNFLSIREAYSITLSDLNASEKIITDKMPTNFENIGFILKAFPEAKIIHVKRDAMAICWSIYQRYFPSSGIGFPYNMDDLAKFYNSYTEMMTFWHDLFPNKIYDINYEDLTINQEYETRKLLKYCELEWDKNCLNFQNNERAVRTSSSLQVKEKMYQGSSEVWKNYRDQLELMIKALGYKS